jgi:hypothetical protein
MLWLHRLRAQAVALTVWLSKVTAVVWRGLVWLATYRAPFVGSKISKDQLRVAMKRADAESRRRERPLPFQRRKA